MYHKARGGVGVGEVHARLESHQKRRLKGKQERRVVYVEANRSTAHRTHKKAHDASAVQTSKFTFSKGSEF